MAASDVKAFPAKDVAFRLQGKIISSSTGNPITGGLTSLAAQVSKDGATFVSTTNSPAEIGTSGYWTLDLTASECNFSSVLVRVTASNSNAVEYSREIAFGGIADIALALNITVDGSGNVSLSSTTKTAIATSVWSAADTGDAAGRATTMGGLLSQAWRRVYNKHKVDRTAGTLTVYRDDSTTVMLSGTVSQSSSTSEVDKSA